MKKRKKRMIGRPKTRLGLPDLDQSKATVIGGLRSPESQRGYSMPLTNSSIGIVLNRDSRSIALSCCAIEFTWNLAPGTINVRLAAVRRLAYEAADAGLLSRELAAGIRALWV